MPDSIFFYLCSCHDEGFLPDEDTMYERFPEVDEDEIEGYMKRFVAVHEMDGINVLWEGELPIESVRGHHQAQEPHSA